MDSKSVFEVKVLKGFEFTPSGEMARQKGLTWANKADHLWFVAYHNGRQAACAGMVVLSNGKARFKTDTVLPEFRRQGLYARLSAMRLAEARAINCTEATCFSSRDSRAQFLKDGFVADGEENSSTGVLYMRKTFDRPAKSW